MDKFIKKALARLESSHSWGGQDTTTIFLKQVTATDNGWVLVVHVYHDGKLYGTRCAFFNFHCDCVWDFSC